MRLGAFQVVGFSDEEVSVDRFGPEYSIRKRPRIEKMYYPYFQWK